MNILDHANTEFHAAGWVDADGKFIDDFQQDVCKCVTDLLEVFSKQGHSGSTAPYVINLFEKLASHKPLVPITGEDWEWVDVGDGMFQNKRASHIFKQADRFNGQAYDINAIVFREWHHHKGEPDPIASYYTSGEGFRPITFPYTPTTEYVDHGDASTT